MRSLCCYSAVRLSLLVRCVCVLPECEADLVKPFASNAILVAIARSMFIGSCDPVILFILHHAPVLPAPIFALSLSCVGVLAGARTPQPHSFQFCGIGSSHLWHFIGNILSQKHSRRNSKSTQLHLLL
jgi:hypothetical protein